MYTSDFVTKLTQFDNVHERLSGKLDEQDLVDTYADIVPSIYWRRLEIGQHNCQGCNLHRTCKHKVPGYGSRNARLAIIGEAPGALEEEFFTPFVGDAGHLLTLVLLKAGVKREQVYMTNVVKCRPPNNKTPTQEQMTACLPILEREISLLKPRVIVTLGNPAMKALRPNSKGITTERGRWQKYNNIPLLHTLHPSYVVRHLGTNKEYDLKLALWEDINKALKKSKQKAKRRRQTICE